MLAVDEQDDEKTRGLIETWRRFLIKLITCVGLSAVRRRHFRRLLRGGIFHTVAVWWRFKFRQPKKYKYYLSVLACCKDEGQYLQEWVEYYLLQGVEHFYLYNNNGTDNSQEILQPYIDKGLITWVDWPGKKQQVPMYKDGILRSRYETRWLMIVDLDEFMMATDKRRLADVLPAYEDYNQLLVYWMCYGSSGHKTKTPGLVIERFTWHREKPEILTKAVLWPLAVVRVHVHSSDVLGKTADEHKNNLTGQKERRPSIDLLRVNHYLVKSWEEYLEKKKRGDAYFDFKPNLQTDRYFTVNDCNEVEEPDLMTDYVRRINERIGAGKAV